LGEVLFCENVDIEPWDRTYKAFLQCEIIRPREAFLQCEIIRLP